MGGTIGKVRAIDSERLREEIDKNYEVFTLDLDKHMRSHANEYALMRKGRIVEFCDTSVDAMRMGNRRFRDGIFSIQKVTKKPVDLGVFSRA